MGTLSVLALVAVFACAASMDIGGPATSSLFMNKVIDMRRGKLLTTLPFMGKEYSVSFYLYPTGFGRGWNSVIHFTTGGNVQQYGHRIPAVWFHGGSNYNKLHVCSAVNNNKNFCVNPQIRLRPHKWTFVKISQKKEHGKYFYRVKVNNQVVVSKMNRRPTVFRNVKVYSGDPWHNVQPGHIRNLRVTGAEQMLVTNKMQITKGKLLKTLPFLGKEYSIGFSVFPTEHKLTWTSVVHLTNGGDNKKYGSRTPGVWLHGGRMYNKLHICSAINGNKNYCYNPTYQLPMYSWTHIRISQTRRSGGSYLYKIQINHKTVFQTINRKAGTFHNVQVYAGDLWYPSQPGYIKNLAVAVTKPKLLIEKQTHLQKNTKITTLPYMGEEFSVSFEILPTMFEKTWNNVIHLTTGGDKEQYGSRIPGVWLHGGRSYDRLHICSAVNGNKNYCVNPSYRLPKYRWTHVRISQTKEGYRVLYRIEINHRVVFSIRNYRPQVFHAVKVYAADKWYPSQPGYIRNLAVLTG